MVPNEQARAHGRSGPAFRLQLLALAVLAGDLGVQAMPMLPPAWLALGLLPLAIVCWRWRRLWPVLGLAAGFGLALWQADAALDARLPPNLAGKDFVVSGQLRGLPRIENGLAHFDLRVRKATLDGRPVALDGVLALAWYGRRQAMPPCSRWQLRVRLKPPRALVNPGGFDSARQALVHGVVAVGYVRDEGRNRHIGSNPVCLDAARARVSAALAGVAAPAAVTPLLQALAVGDTRGLSEQHWAVARATGITHLLAISGFHVGIAGLFGAFLAGLAWRLWPWRGGPRPLWQAPAALLMATAYAALAGMSLPTRRTLVMIAVVCLAHGLRRGARGGDSLALALLAVLALQPLAVLSAGFWLSFAGVAFLLIGLAPGRGWRSVLMQLLRAQLMMTVALLPLTVFFFGQASLLGGPVNLLAVPLVSLVLVPLLLVGCLCLPCSAWLAAVPWQLAALLLDGLWRWLVWLASWPQAQWYLPQASLLTVLLASAGAFWLLLPRGLPARWLGALLFVPLLWPAWTPPAAGGFRMLVLDVGQGLSVLVRTRQHALLYDAGARYPSGFDLGEAVVVPALRALGVRELDLLMVSHGDNDHAGGAAAVARAFPRAVLMGSEPERTGLPLALCRRGQRWQWDGVQFAVLHPASAWREGSNNGSCVLQVRGAGATALLTGDISSLVEPAVARQIDADQPLVLLVPHHGSASSSRAGFLAATQPVLAVISAGWHNRFGHPAAATVARYRAAGVPLYNTADAGAVMIDFPPGRGPQVAWRARCAVARYWRARNCDAAVETGFVSMERR